MLREPSGSRPAPIAASQEASSMRARPTRLPATGRVSIRSSKPRSNPSPPLILRRGRVWQLQERRRDDGQLHALGEMRCFHGPIPLLADTPRGRLVSRRDQPSRFPLPERLAAACAQPVPVRLRAGAVARLRSAPPRRPVRLDPVPDQHLPARGLAAPHTEHVDALDLRPRRRRSARTG